MSLMTTGQEEEKLRSRPEAVARHLGERHAIWVRICHWLAAASILALAVSGYAMLMTNPRLCWGEVCNPLTPAFLELPVSRNYQHGGWGETVPFFDGAGSPVTASRGYEILNLNGWARSLHFLVSWFLVSAGLTYLLFGLASGHLRRHLVPRPAELMPRALWADLVAHARLQIRPSSGGPPYGLLQKCAYFLVIFVVVPLLVLTGLTMSPAVTAAYPVLLDIFGGYQSARTLHFFLFVALLLFLFAHLLMVFLSGFGRQLRAMTLGQVHDR